MARYLPLRNDCYFHCLCLYGFFCSLYQQTFYEFYWPDSRQFSRLAVLDFIHLGRICFLPDFLSDLRLYIWAVPVFLDFSKEDAQAVWFENINPLDQHKVTPLGVEFIFFLFEYRETPSLNLQMQLNRSSTFFIGVLRRDVCFRVTPSKCIYFGNLAPTF